MINQFINETTLTNLPTLGKLLYYDTTNADITYMVTGYTVSEGNIIGGTSYSVPFKTIAQGISVNFFQKDFDTIAVTYNTYTSNVDKWVTIKSIYDTYHTLSSDWDKAYTTFKTNSGSWIIPSNAHPVGSIYITVNNVNPSLLFAGTTWVRYAQGRVLVGRDPGVSTYNTVGCCGGAYNAVIDVNHIPPHTHTFKVTVKTRPINTSPFGEGVTTGIDKTGGDIQLCNPTSGSNSVSHNNIQPYITAYIWRRTS